MSTDVWEPPEQGAFRDTLGRFATGVVVVAGWFEERPYGLTCQSFFSVSLQPPLIAISPSVSSSSWVQIERSGAFSVSVLAASQEELCLSFGRGGPKDKFATTRWHRAPSGSPLVDGAVAWLDCSIEAAHPAGDHHLILGRVHHLKSGDGPPLLFHRGGFGSFRMATPEPVRRVGAEWGVEEVWGSGLWLEGVDW